MLKNLIILAAAFGVISAPLFGALADDGKALYDKKCKMCHGANGDGKNDKGELTASMKKVTDATKIPLNREMTDEQIKKSMTDGAGTMKPVKGLADADIAALVTFTKTFKK